MSPRGAGWLFGSEVTSEVNLDLVRATGLFSFFY